MLIRNLILGHLTLFDDGETVLIQDYGLTAYVGMWWDRLSGLTQTQPWLPT
jgi:hypothetical protein